ncbi:MAG TPA: ABC transporter ATP-binding protein [Actinomycetota bacterium]|nr:ABC transporter ATP-binding protein [Actinomycetota bacterium]
MNNRLRAAGVSRSFQGIQALREVDLEVGRREVVGLIGPNGAGKTTLVNCVTGFDLPDSGSVVVDGSDVTGWKATRRARAGIARSFQQGHLFGGLSVRENVEVAALGVGRSAREARRRADGILDLLQLTREAEEPAGRLPHGVAMKLGVARALATDPRYMLLDEPAAGLSDSELPAFVAVLRSLADSDRGVLVIDHNMALIMEVCDRLCVLDGGRMIAQGTPEEIRRSEDVAAAYLGGAGPGAPRE